MAARMLSRFVSTFAGALLASVALGAQQPPTVAQALADGSRTVPIDRVLAVVGQRPILFSEALEFIYSQQRQGLTVPPDSVGFAALIRTTVDRLIDDEVLVGAAKQYKIEATDNEVQATVEKFIKQVKATFKTEAEFRDALKKDGFGNESEFRKYRTDADKRDLLMQRSLDSLRAHGRMSAPTSVGEDEITAAFEKAREKIGKKPATISFRQIVVPTRPSAGAKKTSLAKAESLLVEIRKGGDFEKIAKRESMDPTTKEVGGDLGWSRMNVMVPEFERAMFSMRPGQVSDVVETSFGFHIIRVDRVQPAEVKARHILITWKLDSADAVRARALADSVARVWKGGTPFDSLVARFHDSSELKGFPDGYPVDSLPEEYKKAIEGLKTGQFTVPIEIPNPRTGFPKFGVLQVTERVDAGEYTAADLRARIRQQLQGEKQGRRMLDQLRKEQYVHVLP